MKLPPLERPGLPGRLWKWAAAVLALSLLAQLVVPVYGYFPFEGVFGFFAGYSLAACVLVVAVARLIGFLLRRPDRYYDDD